MAVRSDSRNETHPASEAVLGVEGKNAVVEFGGELEKKNKKIKNYVVLIRFLQSAEEEPAGLTPAPLEMSF